MRQSSGLLRNVKIMRRERSKTVIINETSRRTHKRIGSTLVERMRRDLSRRHSIDVKTAAFKLEDQISRAMTEQGINATQLAERLDADKGMISRDLKGGLSHANYQRIISVGQALNHDIVTLVLPRTPAKRKKKLREAFKALER